MLPFVAAVIGYILFIIYGFATLVVLGPTHYLVMSPPVFATLSFCFNVAMIGTLGYSVIKNRPDNDS